MKRFLIGVVLFAAACFLFVTAYFNESPQRLWKRLADSIGTTLRQNAKPSPARVPEVVSKPSSGLAVSKPKAAATPISAIAPKLDPVAWLLEHRERMPKELVLMREEEFPVVFTGSAAGSAKVPPGSMVTLLKLDATTVEVAFQGGSKRLPHEATNLLQLANGEMEKPEPPAIVTMPSAVPNGPDNGAEIAAAENAPFRHPGICITAKQLEEIRNGVRRGQEPWKSWFRQFDGVPDYQMPGPFEVYGRNPDLHRGEFQSDMWQLYRMAMLWVVKKDKRAADKGIEILEAYAKTQKAWQGVEASFLQSDCLNGLIGAEILRSTYPGWTETNTADAKRYFGGVWWDTVGIGKANTGAGSHLWTACQGQLGIKIGMAAAIFCDDRVRFNMCLNAFFSDPLTGLANTLPNGQTGDSGRDEGHWALHVSDYGIIAGMAWCQGVDLFAANDNRICSIVEYCARHQLYGLGVYKTDVPFIPYGCSYLFANKIAPYEHPRVLETMSLIHDAYALKKLPTPFSDELVKHEHFKPIYTLDSSIQTVPASPYWAPPVAAPLTNLHPENIGSNQGATNHTGDIWTLTGNTKKAETGYRFAYQEARGDFVFIARVYGGGGIIATERLEPFSHSPTVWFETGQKGTSVVHWTWGRHSYQLPWDLKYFPETPVPLWLKLVRRGVCIAAFQSVDGVSWAPSANVLFNELSDRMFVGLACWDGEAKFDSVSFGSAPSSLPAAPADVKASIFGTEVKISWKCGANTAFYDVLRSEKQGGPYTTIASRVTGNGYTDTVARSSTFYYVISPAGYSGRGPNSKEVSVTSL